MGSPSNSWKIIIMRLPTENATFPPCTSHLTKAGLLLLLPSSTVGPCHHRYLPVWNLQSRQRMSVTFRYAEMLEVPRQGPIRQRFKLVHKMHQMPANKRYRPPIHATTVWAITLLSCVPQRPPQLASGKPLRWHFARILEVIWAWRADIGWRKWGLGDPYG